MAPPINSLLSSLPPDVLEAIVDAICTETRRTTSTPPTYDNVLGPMLDADHALQIRHERVGGPKPKNSLITAFNTLSSWSSTCRATSMDDTLWRRAFYNFFTSPLDPQRVKDEDLAKIADWLYACSFVPVSARKLFWCIVRASSTLTSGVARAAFEIQFAWDDSMLQPWGVWLAGVTNSTRALKTQFELNCPATTDAFCFTALVQLLQCRGFRFPHERQPRYLENFPSKDAATKALMGCIQVGDARGTLDLLDAGIHPWDEVNMSGSVLDATTCAARTTSEMSRIVACYGAHRYTAQKHNHAVLYTLIWNSLGNGTKNLWFHLWHLDIDPTVVGRHGDNALHYAIGTERYKAAHVLLDFMQILMRNPAQCSKVHAFVNQQRRGSGTTPLHNAAEKGQDDLVFRLLEMGADARHCQADCRYPINMTPNPSMHGRRKQLKQVNLLLSQAMARPQSVRARSTL